MPRKFKEDVRYEKLAQSCSLGAGSCPGVLYGSLRRREASSQPAESKPAESKTESKPAESTPESSEASEPAESSEASEAEEDVDLMATATTPREETLYYGGILWKKPINMNPFSTNSQNMCMGQNGISRVLCWETLYMYNPWMPSCIPCWLTANGFGTTIGLKSL